MSQNYFFHNLAEWMDGSGNYSDVVLSSRVRLARNLSSISFPNAAHDNLLKEVLHHISEASLTASGFYPKPTFLKIAELLPLERFILLERHLISTELLSHSKTGGVVIKDGEELSLMINEEDHIRLQVIKSGLNLGQAWEIANGIDNELSSLLQFSFDRRLGYLTACPTNLGTGMRVSVLLHLPALVLSKRIDQKIDDLFQKGYSVRGIYGEGSSVRGSFFQLSNTHTLGVSEIDLINSMYDVTSSVIDYEQETRELIYAKAKYQTEDKVFRSMGILKSAKMLNSDETLNLLSAVRMGVSMGMINPIPIATLNRCMIFSQPAHIQFFNDGKALSPDDRDVKRADWVRDLLSEYHI